MKHGFLFFLLILIMNIGKGFSFDKFESTKITQLNHSRFSETKQFPEYLFLSLNYEKNHLLDKPEKSFLIVNNILLLSILDKDIQQIALRNKSSWLSDFFQQVNYFGDKRSALIALSIHGMGIVLNKPSWRIFSAELLATYGIASLHTQLIKNFLGRKRPYAANDQYQFTGPGIHPYSYRSFPSGHSTIAFASATIINGHIQNRIVRTVIYVLAMSTSLARVYKNKHWASDVVFGAIIGYSSGKLVIKISRKLQE